MLHEADVLHTAGPHLTEGKRVALVIFLSTAVRLLTGGAYVAFSHAKRRMSGAVEGLAEGINRSDRLPSESRLTTLLVDAGVRLLDPGVAMPDE